MNDTRQIIARLRRDLLLGSIVRAALFVCAAAALVMGRLALPGTMGSSVPIMAVLTAWLLLTYRSYRGSRLAAQLPALIASGNLREAEQVIAEALRSFCMFRGPKLRTLHNLAVLRHAQQRWGETVVICRELLAGSRWTDDELARSTRVMLAEALLEAGDMPGVYAVAGELCRQRLTLDQTLRLAVVRTRYLAGIGAWEPLAHNIGRMAELAELMDSDDAAMVWALLALGAMKTGRGQWASFLRRRAELLGNPADMISLCPALDHLWSTALISQAHNTDISSGCEQRL